jgi:hypothetical protein
MRRLLVFMTMVAGLVVGVLASAASAQATYPIIVGGQQVTRVGGIQVSGTSTGSLAFTGANHTLTYVLIALGLVAVGLVLVVATRRRTHVLSRA